MYDVTLINLDPVARTLAPEAIKVEQRGLTAHDVQRLLRNFCEIDPLETANSDAEIRVRSSSGTWIVRAGQRKLILYDAQNREAPGHLVDPEEVLSEIDGSASAARVERAMTAAPFPLPAAVEPVVVSPPAGRRRILVLTTIVALQVAGLVLLRWLGDERERPDGFEALAGQEAEEARASLAGVYLTGSQPGHHGIVLGPTSEVRLFEFRATDAPRLVHATAVVGRSGGQLCLATDQPGGIVTVRNRDVLVYAGEVYTRLP